MKRAVLFAIAGAVMLGWLHTGDLVSAQGAEGDALSFFKNYIITGDYAVGGVGLRGQGVNGLATGNIAIQGVPERTDIVAAFLYWQVVAGDDPEAGSLPVTFEGHPLHSADGPFGKQIGTGTAACWTPAGVVGTPKTYSYRADVLRLLDIDAATGKFRGNGLHQVQLPDGNGVTALGATLLLVYRDSSLPLSAIVLYDGTFTVNQATPVMSQEIKGFYQSSSATAKLTHVVGSGQAGRTERLLFNGAAIAANPFSAAAGASWDNPTYTVNAPLNLTTVTTGGDIDGATGDCLSWSSVIYRTEVQDTDRDGLLDVWELNSAASATPLVDPTGAPLPYLADMGANPAAKDVFIEIGYMDTADDLAYGGVTKPAHTHLPSHEALKLVGDAFKNAPEPIAVHFDVGDGYPAGDPNDPAKNADEYIIRGAGLARGGESIPELSTVCARLATDAPWVCQFSDYPGTVGWKTGFRYLRDEVLSVTPPIGLPEPPPGEEFCDTPGYTCNRRFDANRMDMFRYVLFAHSIALPKSEQPCLDPSDVPVEGDPATGQCTAPLRDNPDFHVPRTNTGVGDFPGGDAMVTLGAFTDIDGLPIGSPFMQASTLMHEFGHNAERRHGGESFAPNCTPIYLSVMNYLYQLRGLLDDDGRPHLDFSRQVVLPSVNETALSDGSHAGLPYRIGWYAPLAGSYLEGFGRPATKHCDGSDVLATDPSMVRIDNRTSASGIDWSANGVVDSGFTLDVNFNGRSSSNGSAEILRGSDDWSNLVLNQTGARRNTGGLYVDTTGRLALGPLSLDSGRGDLGRGDLGRGDLGRGDLGRGDLGRGDLGRGDLGRGDLGRGDLGGPALGRGDLGRGDLGGGDLFQNNPNMPSGELDYETAVGTAKTPPNELRACIVGVDCPVDGEPVSGVRLDWKAPNVGDVVKFTLYRVTGPSLLPGSEWVVIGETPAVLGQTDYSAIDTSELSVGTPFTYFAIATYSDGTQSDPSNFVTLTIVNAPPRAVDDSYSTAQGVALVQRAPGVLGNDTDANSSLSAVLIQGPSHGVLQLNADGSFTYTPAPDFVGTDGFTYGATDGLATSSATASIVVTRTAYGFNNVQNLPPPKNKTFNRGSSVPLRWQFTIGGVAVDSAAAQPEIVILSPAGAIIYAGTPADPGSSSFQPPTAANGYTWQFNWQTKGLAAGTYSVYVGSKETGQVFSAGKAFGPFPIKMR